MKKQTIKSLVFEVLNGNKTARKDDYVLIAEIIKKQNNEHLSPKEMQAIIKALTNWHVYGLPNIHTVFRERRFLQVKHPYLIDAEASAERKAEETYYHNTYKQ